MRLNVETAIAFLFGLTTAIQIKVGGVLLGSDAAALFLFPFLMISKPRRNVLKGERLLLGGLLFWLVGAILTDIYRETALIDFARGWSKIIFFTLNIACLLLLSRYRLHVLQAAILGSIGAGLISTVFVPNEFISSDLLDPISWKFGLGPVLTSLAAFIGALALTRRRFGVLGVAGPLLVMAALNLGLNARSQFGLAAAAALFCVLKTVIDALPGLRKRFSIPAFAILLGLGIGVSQILISIYEMAAKSGALGMDALDKYNLQGGQGLNLLQAGRIESLVSIQAVLDSPILGHGSWARDINYVVLLVKKLDALGFPMQGGDPFLDDLIPTHSHLFGAWVEAGVAGGVFWIGALVLALRALYQLLRMENAPTALVSFLTISMVWDILFSPFGQEQRFLMALKICLALWAVRQAQDKDQTSLKSPKSQTLI